MNFCKLGTEIIKREAKSIFSLIKSINDNFHNACRLLLSCTGHVIFIGMGKSGHIAKKISSTFSSTGTPSFFIHPGEANHGDLGMITRNDIIVIISYSGCTDEVISIIPLIKNLKLPIITITGNEQSYIAKKSDININTCIEKEACHLNLIPTASTTAALVIGDALAISLSIAKNFREEDFLHFHPKGTIGNRFLIRINEIWNTNFFIMFDHQTISQAIIKLSSKKLATICVINSNEIISGIFTYKDIKKMLVNNINIYKIPLKKVVNKNYKITENKSLFATEALKIMKKNNIKFLIIVNEKQYPISIVHLHDLLRIGIFR